MRPHHACDRILARRPLGLGPARGHEGPRAGRQRSPGELAVAGTLGMGGDVMGSGELVKRKFNIMSLTLFCYSVFSYMCPITKNKVVNFLDWNLVGGGAGIS